MISLSMYIGSTVEGALPQILHMKDSSLVMESTTWPVVKYLLWGPQEGTSEQNNPDDVIMMSSELS